MKDITVILTGGTIGSDVKHGSIGISSGTTESIIRMYKEENGDAHNFDIASPFTILSENLTPDDMNELLLYLKTIDTKECRGIIITHGSDTLSYTAAFLGSVLKDLIYCPIVLVAADKPPLVHGSNAYANFEGAVNLIDFLSLAGCYNDVFAVWQKGGSYNAYLGRELKEADSAGDDFLAFGGMPFAEFLPQGISLTGNGYSWRVVINDLHDNRCEPVPDADERMRILEKGINTDIRIKAVRPYPGFSYGDEDIENFDAVLVYGYHSGTFCTGEGAGRVKDDRLTFQALAGKCRESGKTLYVASFKEDETDVYESLKGMDGAKVKRLYDMSFEAAYANCLMLESLK